MHTSITPMFNFEGTLTFASVAANTVATQTVTLPTGVTFPTSPNSTPAGGPALHMELPNLQAGLLFSNEQVVNAAGFNQFKVTFFNNTGGGLTPTGTIAKLLLF